MATKLSDESLTEIRERLVKATAGPWESDNQKDEHGASYYQSLAPDGKVLFDTYNSTAAVIHEEVDEDGYYKWDEVGRCNIAFAINARTDIPALLDHCTALEEERERLLNLVRYCRHELLDKNLITRDEFASLLEEGSAAKLETYDQLRAQLAAADELHLVTVMGKIALEEELKAAQEANFQAGYDLMEHSHECVSRARLVEAVRASEKFDEFQRATIVQLIQTFEPER